ncbi:hypothetical protein FACS1894166_10610 [Bacilli bacterium]|nr:hypothetical protein FACS1894166_10610 [Bacilli bacterium]
MSRKNKHYYYYINIASPFIYENEVIKYIDFDLDFKIPDTNVANIYELDVDEFNENKVKYNYPPEIIKKILEAEQAVKTKYHNKELNKFLNPDVMKKQDENYQNKRNYGRHN